jgi:alcohol dehydrogenase
VALYPREAIPRMVAMVPAGLIDVAQFDVTEFGLDEANAAVAHAAANAGPRQLTVLRPDRIGARGASPGGPGGRAC